MSPTKRVEEIWETAERLFSEYGYHATSMRLIAGELGLEGGSLYAHIDSKEDILRAVIRRAGDQFLAAMGPIVASEAAPEEKLRAALRTHFRLVAENLAAATVYFHEWRFLRSRHRSSVLERRDRYEKMFRDIVAEGVEAGVFRDVDPRFAGMLILSVSNWLYQWFNPTGPLSPEELADIFTDLILRGLLSRIEDGG